MQHTIGNVSHQKYPSAAYRIAGILLGSFVGSLAALIVMVLIYVLPS